MFIIVVMVVAFAGLLVSLVCLADFARASRRDALFQPASNRRARRGRRLTGMYIRDLPAFGGGRDGGRTTGGPEGDGLGDVRDGDELVGR